MIFKLRNLSLLKRAVALCFLLQLSFLFVPNISHAQLNTYQIGYIPDFGLGTSNDIEHTVTRIIQIFLGFLGFIALVIIIYGGFVWMTSGGNQEKIKKAKGILKSAIIGLVLILLSYVIVTFVMNLVYKATHGDGGDGGTHYTDTGGDDTFGNGTLGGGVIENHYPERDAINVPRNTMIMVTFKVPVATSTIVNNDNPVGCNNYNINGSECGTLNTSGVDITNGSSGNLDSDKVIAVLQSDGKSILLDPTILLGSNAGNVNINVHLKSGILLANGNPLFSNADGYSWNFTVSTFSDTTPPTVTRVWPTDTSTVKRNAIIQINFSEPINILSVPNNIIIKNGNTEIPGELKISNRYKTVEFLSSTPCDGVTTNSCGETVYCLPAAVINSLIKSGTLGNPLSGISDSAGNLLDGNKNGNSDGSTTDDYNWSFTASSEIDITAPIIVSVFPTNNAVKISLNSEVYATFDKLISSSSLNSDSFYIYKFLSPSCPDVSEKENIPSNCFPNYSVYLEEDGKSANINIHSPYLSKNFIYRPRLTSDIKDSYGNCFNPSLGPGRTNSTQPQQQ